jgi:predicted transcriptional regulator
METFCDLLFELSSVERMNMMLALRAEKMKMSHLAQRLDITVTETSRHLQRLSDAGLVARDLDGSFRLTPFGELAQLLLWSLEFVSDKQQYFNTHSLLNIPLNFINRLGEFSSSRYEGDTVKVFDHARVLLLGAEEYIWVQSYQHLLWNTPIVVDKIRSGVDFRLILPKDVEPSPDYTPDPSMLIRTRFMDRVDLRIALTEKEASVSFPHMDGSVDYAAFIGDDPAFLSWCRDLFIQNWETAGLTERS